MLVLGSHSLDPLSEFIAWLHKRFLGITGWHRVLLGATAQDCHQHLGPQAVLRDDLEAAMQLLGQNHVYSYCFPPHRKSHLSPWISFCILLLSLSVAGSRSTSHLTPHHPSYHWKSSEIQELIILPLCIAPLATHHPSCYKGQQSHCESYRAPRKATQGMSHVSVLLWFGQQLITANPWHSWNRTCCQSALAGWGHLSLLYSLFFIVFICSSIYFCVCHQSQWYSSKTERSLYFHENEVYPSIHIWTGSHSSTSYLKIKILNQSLQDVLFVQLPKMLLCCLDLGSTWNVLKMIVRTRQISQAVRRRSEFGAHNQTDI